MLALEERFEKLANVEQLIDDERQARVTLEDTVQVPTLCLPVVCCVL